MAWFGRKRWGWGLQPTSWQGWALTIAYGAIAITLGATLASSRVWLFATLFVIVTALYLVVAFRRPPPAGHTDDGIDVLGNDVTQHSERLLRGAA